jgi:hypothetical protein
MKTNSILVKLVGLLVLAGSLATALADHPWLEAESTYLGDGWFRYRFGSRVWPIMEDLTLCGAGINFSNKVAYGTLPSGWTNSNHSGASWTQWDYGSQAPAQVLPYDATFEVRSSLTNYHLGLGFVTMSLILYEFKQFPNDGGVYSMNVVGYWMFPTLVPCLPEQADASPASSYTNLTYQDTAITELIRDTQGVKGLKFVNGSDSTYGDSGRATYLLEASSNMQDWRNAAYIYALPGIVTWTTNIDLGQWGNFFRLEFVSNGYIAATDLPPLDPPAGPLLARPATATASMSKIRAVAPAPQLSFADNGQVNVGIDTVPGLNYEVFVSSLGKVVWSTRCTASQTRTVLPIPVATLPPKGIIQTKVLP